MSERTRFFAATSGREIEVTFEPDEEAMRKILGYTTVRAEFEYRVEFHRVRTYDLLRRGEVALGEVVEAGTVPPSLIVPKAYLAPGVEERAVKWWEERGPVGGALISEVVGADPVRVMTTYARGFEGRDTLRMETDEMGE